MKSMKWYVALLAITLAQAAEIGEVKTVYVLPMSGSLDQFVAMHLTSANVLQVVTDPKRADAILCDRIGETLNDQLDGLFGKANPPEKKPADDSKPFLQVDADKPVVHPVSHSRGTIFLIDRKTRNVLWSAYEPPKSTSAGDLNRAAGKIATKLAKELKGPKRVD